VGRIRTGSAQYNYELSQRRADAVVQYLAGEVRIAAHRFYLIGIGKDQEVASNTTADGRKKNRRVEVQLLSNMGDETTQQECSERGTRDCSGNKESSSPIDCGYEGPVRYANRPFVFIAGGCCRRERLGR